MKSQLLLLALVVAALTSCTTAYKTGQTPDDVYYSPTRPQDEYVRMEKEDDRRYSYQEDYYEDRYLRMKIRNRYMWNDLNDWYSYERWGFGHNYYYGSYYNPYNSWNYYYNPYCSPVVFVNTRYQTTYSQPRMVNLNTYNQQTSTASNPKLNFSNPKYNVPGWSATGNTRTTSTYNAPRNSSASNGSNTGSFLRNIFSGNNSSSSSGSSGTKTTTSGSSSSSSGSSSSGSSAPVRRF